MGSLIICRMINHLDETRIRTLEQVRAVLDGMQTLDFQARCQRASVLRVDRVGSASFHGSRSG